MTPRTVGPVHFETNFTVLTVPIETYDLLSELLHGVGYEHVFVVDDDGIDIINMNGISLTPALPAETP